MFDESVELGWQEIDRQMRQLARRRAALDAEELRLIREVKRAEVFKHLGYGSVIEYLERACAYSPKTAWERVRVAEALEELPAMRMALLDGDVSFSAAKVLTRVVKPETEEDWIVAVQGCTVREIEDAARGHVPGDLPDDPPDPAVETRTVKLELTPEAYALYLEARRALSREMGGDVSDADFMAVACRSVQSDASSSSNAPHHQIAITVCRECQRGWQDAGTTSVEISAAAIDRARCDAIELGDVANDNPNRAHRTVPPATRRKVLARDQHRCTVPGCRSSRFIEVHHIKWRSRGGNNKLSNLTSLCGRHHDSVHHNLISITGTAGSLVVTHADGRLYGTQPDSTRHVASPEPRPPVRSPHDATPIAPDLIQHAR